MYFPVPERYKGTNTRTLTVLLKMRVPVPGREVPGGGGSLSSAQAGLQAIFPCGLAGWFLVICFAVVTDHVVFHAPCVSGKCHHC